MRYAFHVFTTAVVAFQRRAAPKARLRGNLKSFPLLLPRKTSERLEGKHYFADDVDLYWRPLFLACAVRFPAALDIAERIRSAGFENIMPWKAPLHFGRQIKKFKTGLTVYNSSGVEKKKANLKEFTEKEHFANSREARSAGKALSRPNMTSAEFPVEGGEKSPDSSKSVSEEKLNSPAILIIIEPRTMELGSSSSSEKNDSEESATTNSMSNYVKHPLMYTWMLWYLKNERNKLWSDCLRSVGKVSTIEDFWSLYRIIQEASTLQVGSDYYFFKENIRPEWEDAMNCNGGRWIVTVDRNSHRVDAIWLELLVAMLGEQFGMYSEQICGAAVNIRHRGFKVCLWTRDALNEEANLRIGQIMKEKLGIQESISYESHADAGVKHDSTFKAKYKV